jgi:hypothetical protein
MWTNPGHPRCDPWCRVWCRTACARVCAQLGCTLLRVHSHRMPADHNSPNSADAPPHRQPVGDPDQKVLLLVQGSACSQNKAGADRDGDRGLPAPHLLQQL